MRDTVLHIQQIGTAYQIDKTTNTHLRHQFTQFFGDEEEVVHHVLRLTGKFTTQLRILGRNTDRASIEMTLTHHDATLNHQRRGRKTELVSTQQRTDQHIATGLQLTIHLQSDTSAQLIEHQRLLCLGQTQFPRRTRVLDGRQGRCTLSLIHI